MELGTYRRAFEKVDASLWIEDIAQLRGELRALRAIHGNRLQHYIKTNPEFVIRAASLIEVIDVNEATLQLFGVSDKSDLLGPLARTLDLTHEAAIAGMKAEILAIAGGDSVSTCESVAVTPAGKRLHVSVTAHIPPESEPNAHLIAELVESADSRQLERSVEKERFVLLTLINNIPDFIYMKDTEHRFTLTNRAHAEPLGFKDPSGLLGKTDYDFYLPEEAARFAEDEDRIIATGIPLIDKAETSRPDAKIFRWALTTKVPLRDQNGRIVGIVGVGKDITARRETEEKLRAFLDQSTEAMWVAGEEGTIVEFNPSAEELTGISREEALGLPVWRLMGSVMMPGRWSDEMERGIEAQIREALKTGKANFLDKALASSLRRPDGSIRHFEHFYFPIRTRDGYQVGAIAHDITEVRNTRETLRHLENQLHQSQKLEAIGQLAGGVAHDFNNILTAIMGYCSILRTQIEDNPENLSLVDSIMKAARRAAHVTEGLLIFSRKGAASLVAVDLNGVVGQNEEFLRRAVGEELDLQFSYWPEPVLIGADRTQLGQVLVNLVANARDSMPNGGQIHIRITCEAVDAAAATESVRALPGRYAHLAISDNGAGMDPQTREKIFEPFFTTKAIGKGSGLGLSIVWGIVDEHRGFITVDTELQKGTTFHVYLPMVEGPVGYSASVGERPAVQAGETILVAEDEEMLRRLICSVLESAGYKVLEAVDGSDAVAQFTLHRDEIDLVLLDVSMPSLDGRVAYREIERNRPAVKVIFMSGHTSDTDESRHSPPPDGEMIHKPFTPQFLTERVRRVLDS
ncbi:MAG TPA: PAS domain-containing protein [Spirochaetia bacterium]|nr:PAS domain-containing protein [Spirochaetia bacterium]